MSALCALSTDTPSRLSLLLALLRLEVESAWKPLSRVLAREGGARRQGPGGNGADVF